ncbi:exported hypothetical protein [uncultured Desulfatiglans sp.]|nr:exported hypothetical protein [uncultured Desulfatiglans sp.]
MVFFANLCVNLHVCLCGDLQVASAQTLDFLDIGKKSSFPDGNWTLGSFERALAGGLCPAERPPAGWSSAQTMFAPLRV